MARNSSRLTKFRSAVTIVTADIANSWYGGLYNSTDGRSLSDTDPLVAGHVHDGEHLDGHAQKINLVDHVTGQLRNSNLEDEAVDKRVITKQINQSDAIPEYEVISGVTYYYLDLSDLRSTINALEYDSTNDVVRVNTDAGLTYTGTDFVIGSPTLDYDSTNAIRFFFDKAKGAFRSGSALGTQWNNTNIGLYSVAFGSNTTGAGPRSFVTGLTNTINATSEQSSIIGGGTNTITAGETTTILSGDTCVINTASFSTIASGELNQIGNGVASTSDAFIGGGVSNTITGLKGAVVGGQSNDINSSYAFVGGGLSNEVLNEDYNSEYGSVVGGRANSIHNTPYSFIGGGYANAIDATLPGNTATTNVIVGGGGATSGNSIGGTGPIACFIGAGKGNAIDIDADSGTNGMATDGTAQAMQTQHVIVGGQTNTITANTNFGEYGFIGNGLSNNIAATSAHWTCNTILNGINCDVIGSDFNLVLTGRSNAITGATTTTNSIFNGINNTISGVDYNTIINGNENSISTSSYSFISTGITNVAANDYVSIISSSNVTGNDYGAIYHGPGDNGATNQVIDMVFSGNTATANTTYYLFLNGLDDKTSVSEATGERFSITTGASGSAVLLIGEYIGRGTVAAALVGVGGTIYRTARVSSLGTLTWEGAVENTQIGAGADDFYTATGSMNFAETSNEIAVKVVLPAGYTDFSWTVRVRAIFTR